MPVVSLVESGAVVKAKCALLDNLILAVGILSNFQAAFPPYQVCKELPFVIFKNAVVLPYATWCDVEERNTTQRSSTTP